MIPEHADVFLIQPPYPGLSFETTNVPLGLSWISAVLKRAGFTTRGYDLQVEGMDLDKMGKQIEQAQPKIVGVQFHGQVSFNHSMDVVKYIRKNFPSIPLVAGGQQATFRPEPIIREGKVDFLVQGEGEFVMLDLVKHLLHLPDAKPLDAIPSIMYLKDGKIIKHPRAPRIENLDAIPLPDRDAFDWQKYPQWVIMTSRGCPFRCAFCSSTSFWGNTVRFRSAENVLAEMEQLVTKYKVTSFLILDDTFTLNKPRLEKICQGIIDRKLPITWGCGTRTDQIDEKALGWLKAAGCVEISFGLETANPASLELIKKDVSVEQQRQGILLTMQAGLHARVSVMIGLPGEARDEIRHTLDFLIETEPNEIQIYPIMPYDGTTLHSEMDHLGITICNPNFSDWSKDSMHPIAETRWLSRQQITEMAMEMVTRLAEHGYTHMTGKEDVGKQKLDKVVSTGLTPFQLVESYRADAGSERR
jgi:radical SAM superfamily enzyme YgiQ (UPF0313 family)